MIKTIAWRDPLVTMVGFLKSLFLRLCKIFGQEEREAARWSLAILVLITLIGWYIRGWGTHITPKTGSRQGIGAAFDVDPWVDGERYATFPMQPMSVNLKERGWWMDLSVIVEYDRGRWRRLMGGKFRGEETETSQWQEKAPILKDAVMTEVAAMQADDILGSEGFSDLKQRITDTINDQVGIGTSPVVNVYISEVQIFKRESE